VANNAVDFAKFDNVSPASGKISVLIRRLNVWQYVAGFSIIEQSGGLLTSPASNPGFITGANKSSSATSLNNTDLAPDKMLNTDYISLQNSLLTIKMNSGQQQIMSLSVIDASGRTFLKTNVTLQKGFNSFNKFIPGITTGIYYIKLLTNKNFIVKPVLNSIDGQ
ncbi:MAG: hypothetical protein ABI419_08880, partial [Ginsengibacter sp.]